MATPKHKVTSPRTKTDGGTHFLKIGASFETKTGGLMITLDALPLPDKEGRVVLMLFPWDDERSQGGGRPSGQGGGGKRGYPAKDYGREPGDDDVNF